MPYERSEIIRPRGVNKDLSPYELPYEMWSEGRNVTFRRERTNKAKGYSNVFAVQDSIAPPLFAHYYIDNDINYWLYMSESEAYTTNGKSVTKVGSGFNASYTSNWTGCNFNSVVVVNNINNHPQVLNPDTLDEVIDMPNWGSYQVEGESVQNPEPWGPAARAEVIRPFKNYLIALDVTDEKGRRYPSMARWSSAADAGDVPANWNPFLTGSGSGTYALSDTGGRILDGLTLGDYFIIYKTDSVWSAEFIGGDFTLRFRKVFGNEAGMLTKECMAEFEGKHFVLSQNGAYIHNASSKEEIMEKWVKDEFFNNVNPDKKLQTKVVADHSNKEVWVYYTSNDSVNGWVDRALIYNWDVKQWSIRDLTGDISYIAEGRVPDEFEEEDVDTWDGGDDITWDSETEIIWTDRSNPASGVPQRLLLADYTARQFYGNETTVDQLGVPLNGWVKRIGIDYDNDQAFKYLNRIVPHLRDTADGIPAPVTVTVYTEDVMTGNPAEEFNTVFDPGLDHDIDCHVSGRWLGVKFEGAELWDLTGYTLEWEPTGTY